MKAVMISIQPKLCELIASGKKTIEVRKTRPKIETPFKAYIYCPYGNMKDNYCLGKRGKVIGEFVCDMIDELHEWELSPKCDFERNRLDLFLKESCVSYGKLCEYRKNLPYIKPLFGWHISQLKIYDKPREIGEFKKAGFMTEEEWLFNLYPNTHCHYEAWAQRFNIEKPPKSWCLVEELKEN